MTKGSLVRFPPGLLGGMVLLVASTKKLIELPHYGDSLVVCEGVLGPTPLREQARPDLQELCLMVHCTYAQCILEYHPIAKQMQ